MYVTYIHIYYINIYNIIHIKYNLYINSDNNKGARSEYRGGQIFFLGARLFGGAILLVRPIGHAKKWALKTKVHVRSRHY